MKQLEIEYHFTEVDPYFKLPHDKREHCHDVSIDEKGHLHVKNISSWWIPSLSITREIGGTIYTVTGTYEGNETMLRKLERIATKKYTEKEADLNDTKESV